mmetsp:Transcript_17954/g.29529  ORF Transcript_17954/g.29529 Transcript_17954/m.29529 type:complete len:98 (-) Transcript_17954:25-318(-)
MLSKSSISRHSTTVPQCSRLVQKAAIMALNSARVFPKLEANQGLVDTVWRSETNLYTYPAGDPRPQVTQAMPPAPVSKNGTRRPPEITSLAAFRDFS